MNSKIKVSILLFSLSYFSINAQIKIGVPKITKTTTTSTSNEKSVDYKVGDIVEYFDGTNWLEGEIAQVGGSGRYQIYYNKAQYLANWYYPKDMKPTTKKNAIEQEKEDAIINANKPKMAEKLNSFPAPAAGQIIEGLDQNFNVCTIEQAKFCRIYTPAGPNKALNDEIAFYYKNGQLYWECKCIYIDKADSKNDKYVGLITIYKENGEEDQIALFDKEGKREYYGNPSDLKNAKYKIGEEVQILVSSGDQEAWVPGVIVWPKGSDSYRVTTPDYYSTAVNSDTYESYIRPKNSAITYKYGLGLTPGPAEPHILALAKKELLELRPGVTIIKNEMNSSKWEITLDVLKIPEYRQKNGRILYKMPNGELRYMVYTYTEDYINGKGYQTNNKTGGLNGEIPVASY